MKRKEGATEKEKEKTALSLLFSLKGMESTPGVPFPIKCDKGVSGEKRTVMLLMVTMKRAGSNAALAFHCGERCAQSHGAKQTPLLLGQA